MLENEIQFNEGIVGYKFKGGGVSTGEFYTDGYGVTWYRGVDKNDNIFDTQERAFIVCDLTKNVNYLCLSHEDVKTLIDFHSKHTL